VATQKTTLYLDEDVLRQTEAAAAGSGRDESEVVEDAFRRYLGLEVVDEIWARNAEHALDPDEALALAFGEVIRLLQPSRDVSHCFAKSQCSWGFEARQQDTRRNPPEGPLRPFP
jgi:hypothetical protein